MKGNLNKIFWGMIFISIHINIPFDILPDIIGYGIILYGLKGISLDSAAKEEVRNGFSIGIIPCKVMIGVEVIKLIPLTSIENNGVMYNNIYTAALNIISIFYIIVIFSILKGMYEIAKSNCEDSLANKMRNKWYIYLSIWILNSVIPPLTINIYSLSNAYNTGILQLLSIVLFVLQIGIIIQLRSLYNRYP